MKCLGSEGEGEGAGRAAGAKILAQEHLGKQNLLRFRGAARFARSCASIGWCCTRSRSSPGGWRTARASSAPSRRGWAKAARMVFAMSPNSASCERVFALLKQVHVRRGADECAGGLRVCRPHAALQQARGGLSCYSCTAVMRERERERELARNERVCEGACMRRRTSLRVPREVARCAVGARSKFCVLCVNHVRELP